MLPDQCKTGTLTNRTRGAGTQVLQLAHSLVVVVVVAQIIPLFIVVNARPCLRARQIRDVPIRSIFLGIVGSVGILTSISGLSILGVVHAIRRS